MTGILKGQLFSGSPFFTVDPANDKSFSVFPKSSISFEIPTLFSIIEEIEVFSAL